MDMKRSWEWFFFFCVFCCVSLGLEEVLIYRQERVRMKRTDGLDLTDSFYINGPDLADTWYYINNAHRVLFGSHRHMHN